MPPPVPAARSVTPRLTVDDLAWLAAGVPAAPGRPLLPIRAPWTGEVVGVVPRCTPDDVAAAVRTARAAASGWAARPVAERAAVLRRLADLVLGAQESLLDVIQMESGKARLHAFEEVIDVALVARYYARIGPDALAPARRRGFVPGLTRVHEHRLPLGVVGVIAPWNYPLSMAITDALPALLAGNAVVLKPGEETPFTALFAARLLDRAGLPPGVLTVLTGSGPALGPALLDGVDFVAFTGSTETGRLVAAGAGERLIGATLELGGKNPLLVLGDADPDRAAEGAVRACFASAGQLCMSVERIYVARPLYEAFTARFAERAECLRIGPGFGYDVDMGSLTTPDVLAKVEAHVADARARGAAVRTGGARLPGLGPLFYAPTVLTGVTDAMRLAREETFGPVVAVYPVDTDDEAVARANDSAYGLNASVWTGDARRGAAVAARVRAGTVTVNEIYTAAWGSVDAPMGGMGASGLGRRHGAAGLLKYTEAQTVAVQHGPSLTVPPGVPPTLFVRGVRAALGLLDRFGRP